MGQELSLQERRQFGRRKTLWHAWVRIAGREREPCVVRNFSVAGALLEFPGAVPAINHFRLTIEEFHFEAQCYVRHRGRTGLGVNFDEFATPDATSKCTAEELVALLKAKERLRGRSD